MAVTEGFPVLCVSGGVPGALDRALVALAHKLQGEGVRVAGAVQHNIERAGHRCDMELEVLPSSDRIKISADLGAAATGCRLDGAGLTEAAMVCGNQLTPEVDLFILNKFGQREVDGSGFRDVLAQAVMQATPVVVGVAASKQAALEQFLGQPLLCVPPEMKPIEAWMRQTARLAALMA